MRISDWSSDVCSADLKVPAKTGSSGTRWPIRKAQRHHDQGQVHEEPECCSQGRADSDISPKYRCSMCRLWRDFSTGSWGRPTLHSQIYHWKIGRAHV